jgi:hypothetical protein
MVMVVTKIARMMGFDADSTSPEGVVVRRDGFFTEICVRLAVRS